MLITDPKEVKRLAEEREDENWRFRTFLKNTDLSVEEIDAVVHRLYEEVSVQINCAECGNCCRETLPVLLQADISRLAEGLGCSEEECMERYMEPVKEPWDETAEVEGEFTFRDMPCVFLHGNTCSIPHCMPDDCRSFPHLHKDEFVFRLIGIVNNCAICPIVFNVYERLKEELWGGDTDSWPGEWDEDEDDL